MEYWPNVRDSIQKYIYTYKVSEIETPFAKRIMIKKIKGKEQIKVSW